MNHSCCCPSRLLLAGKWSGVIGKQPSAPLNRGQKDRTDGVSVIMSSIVLARGLSFNWPSENFAKCVLNVAVNDIRYTRPANI